ncbi:MAG: 3-dehydroquinate synthase II [Candidatus Bathyarchaeota archaeon]|nr:MAG: 3-dehydroquinate synthase II [Candidatus Bathyarchaeota archaeon]
MKYLWVEIDVALPNPQKVKLLKSATQFCDVALVDAKDIDDAKKAGLSVASDSGDADIVTVSSSELESVKKLKADGKCVAVKMIIESKKDEETAIAAAELLSDYVIVGTPDWKIIPLENLIAKTRGKTKLLAEVSNTKEAKVALETLELGSDGVVLKTDSLEELKQTAEFAKKESVGLGLVPVEVTEVKEIGTGARSCIDTCELMKPGEGMLLGCQSSGLFLVQAEVHESPYVETRPFRVNAGPLSLYALTSPNRTRYLSELKSGEEVLIVDRAGNVRVTNVARSKIEWRPMLLIEAEYNGKSLKLIAQNAETIRVVTPEGSKAVTDLTKGDKILAQVEEGGRHFGTLVKEEAVIEC